MKVKSISKNEYFKILKEFNIDIPLFCGYEAYEAYETVDLLLVSEKDNKIALFFVPIDNDSIRRKYRFFPYLMPIMLKKENNLKIKEINKILFNYLFNNYSYVFIPLHPDYKMISSVSSLGGFVEMRHTHILYNKITFDDLNSKLKNHIRNAKKYVNIIIDKNIDDYEFEYAIKGKKEEVKLRSKLAKNIIKNNNGFAVKAYKDNKVIAGLIIANDNGWMYLLHSYQKEKIRGVVPLMIINAIEYSFNNNCKCFDFEGSVIDDIDDFFASFDAQIVTYPYVIYAEDKEKFNSLINRSRNIEGRVKK